MANEWWRPKLAAARGHRWQRPPKLLEGKSLGGKAARGILQERTRVALISLAIWLHFAAGQPTVAGHRRSTSPGGAQRGARRAALQEMNDSEHLGQLDPMEPCYLANNRASETLTISESTPVGTVVGELMVSRHFSGTISLTWLAGRAR